jgi:hypothetical protein
MKKLLLTAAAIAASLNLYAQGTVTFQNSTATLVQNGLTGLPVAEADGIRAMLYWAPASDANNFTPISGATVVGKAGALTVAGRFSGGTATTGAATAPGAGAWFQVKAWELAYGTTYEIASAAPASGGRQALRGESNKFLTSSTGNPPLTPAVNLATSGLQGFTVVVPEPSVIALGLIGAGALLALRRRK